MARGRKKPEETRLIVIRMSMLMGHDEIQNYTGLKKRTIERIISDWKRTGNVMPEPRDEKSQMGRPRILDVEDMAVWVCNTTV